MPSDERVQLALRALRRRRAAYRASVARSLAWAKEVFAVTGGGDQARQELGMFGASRIDAARFADLSHAVALDVIGRTRVEHAMEILRRAIDAIDADDEAFVVRVLQGGTPHAAIGSALSHWGRGFGSALTVDLVRTGQYTPVVHDVLTQAWRFERWSRANRLSAPPIVAVVPGSHFRVADLAEFLDGSMHIALVVEGDCPPAALVRHITPGTLVLQTCDERGLDRFAAYDGPAIAALVPDTAAYFLHDPDAGAAPWQRLQVWHRPERRRGTLATITAGQQREELLQLDALAAQPALPATAIDALASSGSGDAADRLAGWLLAQSGATESA